MECNSIINLPYDVLRHVVSFCTVKDAVSLASCNKGTLKCFKCIPHEIIAKCIFEKKEIEHTRVEGKSFRIFKLMNGSFLLIVMALNVYLYYLRHFDNAKTAVNQTDIESHSKLSPMDFFMFSCLGVVLVIAGEAISKKTGEWLNKRYAEGDRAEGQIKQLEDSFYRRINSQMPSAS